MRVRGARDLLLRRAVEALQPELRGLPGARRATVRQEPRAVELVAHVDDVAAVEALRVEGLRDRAVRRARGGAHRLEGILRLRRVGGRAVSGGGVGPDGEGAVARDAAGWI